MEANIVLTDIAEEFNRAKNFIKVLCGNNQLIVPLKSDTERNAVVDNIGVLMGMKKQVVEYFKPVKIEAKKPYEKALADEKAWIDAIDSLRNFADSQVTVYNQAEKEKIEKIRREQAEKEAAEERSRLEAERQKIEAQKLEAAAAGDTDTVNALNEVAADISHAKSEVEVIVQDVEIKARGNMATQTEKATLDIFEITDHGTFIMACIDAGLLPLLTVSSKTETAFKKWLLENATDRTAFPGCRFKRGSKNLYRGR